MAGKPVPGLSSPLALARLGLMLRWTPYDGLMRVHDRLGPVSAFWFGPWKYVFMLGPEANAFLFANAGLFRWREAFDALVPANGETALIVSDGEEYGRRRRLVQPAFHRRRVDGYIERMAAGAGAVIDTWRAGSAVDVYQELRTAVRGTTVQLLFGDRLAADSDVLGKDLQIVLDAVDMQYGLQKALRTVPNPFWRRITAARARVVGRIDTEISARRRAEAPRDDVLSEDVLAMLLQARDDDGGALSDLEIHDQVISLIAAGYETTSAALAWAVYEMLTTPGVWDRARDEVVAVAGDGPLTADGVHRLTYLDRVVSETLRLHPPAVISARKVAEEFEFGGYRIPAGVIVLYSPYVTHRLPDVWPEPERFRPERWDPDQDGHRAPTPATFLPFGGGLHRCIGSTFARVEMKAMLAQLLHRTELRLVSRNVRPTSITAMRPRAGLRVEVVRTTERPADVAPGLA